MPFTFSFAPPVPCFWFLVQSYVSLSAVDDTVKALKLNGVDASEETVKTGDYVLQRPFLMIAKSGTTDELTNAFLDFVYSAEGQTIIADDGIVPNPNK